MFRSCAGLCSVGLDSVRLHVVVILFVVVLGWCGVRTGKVVCYVLSVFGCFVLQMFGKVVVTVSVVLASWTVRLEAGGASVVRFLVVCLRVVHVLFISLGNVCILPIVIMIFVEYVNRFVGSLCLGISWLWAVCALAFSACHSFCGQGWIVVVLCRADCVVVGRVWPSA